jgi:spermidine/putrescine transport system substrate-binding protein
MSDSGLIRVRSYASVTRRQVMAGAGALGALAALGGLRPAQAATSVTFLGWQGYDLGLNAADFLKKNDLSLSTTYIGNNDEIITKLKGGGMGSIDIVTPYMGYIPLMAALEIIQPIDESKVPNLADCMPVFRDDKNVIVEGTRYGVPFTWGSAPMMYDPAAVSATPASWDDLFKPEYKGKVGMMDDPLGNMMLAAHLATDAEVATMLTPEQLKASIDYLVKLKKEQVRVVSVSWGELADALSRGDVVITFSGWETIKKFCADKGKKIEYVYPKEGTFAWLDNYCIAKDAPHPEQAHAMANHIIGTDAQVMIAEDLVQAIVNKKAVEKLKPENAALYPYNDIDSFGSKATFYAFPPFESDGKHATWDEWLKEYERFKTA